LSKGPATGGVRPLASAVPAATRGPTSGTLPMPPPLEGSRRGPTSGSAPVVASPARGSSSGSWTLTGERSVVLHLLAGGVKRGTLREVDLAGPTLALESTTGVREQIPTDHIKAVFFLKRSEGDGHRAPEGRQVRITLINRRTLLGRTTDDRDQAPGMFLTPTDGAGAAERIFVYRAGIFSVTDG
jgi:hypothetical protein